LRAARADTLCRPGLIGAALRDQLSDAYDSWLAGLLPPRTDVALVAVGGLGRREPAPHSDLDLVLLHDGRVDDLADLADSIWYPVWDSGLGLDHAVRTPQQAVAVARTDLRALLGLLDLRHVAGNAGLTARLRGAVLELWRAGAAKRLPQLQEMAQERRTRFGEASFLLEPNLKESRGGLRDTQALRALAIAQLVDYPPRVREVHPVLLDVRAEAHRATGRADDVLRQEDKEQIAATLGIPGTEVDFDTQNAGDVLLRRVNEAARIVAAALDQAERRIATGQPLGTGAGRRWPFAPARPAAERIGLARDVVAHEGEVALARDADPRSDPGLVLRMARAAAERDLPIAPIALERLAAESAPLRVPWRADALADFLAVIGAGRAAVAVLETLDLAGLLARLLPEWDAVRCRPQHNPVHRFTVDRHLLETAANAAEHDRGVDRRDLLLLGALLHDIGKGYPGADHSVVGAQRAATIVRRMGLSAQDACVVVALVRHHLLLPDTATRRDPDDPVTIRIVREATRDDVQLLDMLHVLAVADAAATGPAAWSDWKAALIAGLVARAKAAMHGRPHPAAPALDEERRRLAERGELAVMVRGIEIGKEIVVAAPDRPGTLHRTAGVLALHSLDVREASIGTHADMAVNRFVVAPRFGRMPDPALLRTDLSRALAGDLDLVARLAEKERSYAPPSGRVPAPDASVLWFDESAQATVVEFRAADRIGLLSRITAALERAGLDVRSARVSSTAGMAVDAFYVTGRDGRPVPADHRAELTGNLEAAVRADVVPAKPAKARPIRP
jgi:[protein-PII] uridylyltransferase